MIGPIQSLSEAHLIGRDLHRSITFCRDVPGLPLAHVIPERNLASFWAQTSDKAMPCRGSFGTLPLCMPLHIAFDLTLQRVRDSVARLRDPDGHSLEVIAMRRTGRGRNPTAWHVRSGGG
jgi:hypothetical protein